MNPIELQWLRRCAAILGLTLSLTVPSLAQAAPAAQKKKAAAQKVAVKKPFAQKTRVVAARKQAVAVAHLKPSRRQAADARKLVAESRHARRVALAERRAHAVEARHAPAQLRAAAPEPLDPGPIDPHKLSANAALVIDQNSQEVLLSKNDRAVMPIASLTKLMTGLLVADARLPLDEEITITEEDVDTYKGTGSRLAIGTRLTRGELMHLALMSSENRAAHALGRTYPGGLNNFVRLMNAKAAELGMRDTHYVEPTGLSVENRSSARDLAVLVAAAYKRPLLRELSTSPGYTVESGRRVLQYRNSNRLIDDPKWEIGLQKTGYIAEAGRCLVMSTKLAGRQVIMIFLDAADKAARIGDAQRVRRWVEG